MTVQLPDPVLDLMPSPDAMLEAYTSSARRFIALARGAEDKADLPVPACPAWSVRGLLAHVTSVATHAAHGLPWGEDIQATIDREVAERADHSLAGIAGEWEALLPLIEQKYAGRGPGPLVVDVVSHEHDLRDALGAADHSAGLPEALSAMVAWVRGLDLVGDSGIVLRTPTSQAMFGGSDQITEVEVPDDWELFRLLGVRRSRTQLEAYSRKGDLAPLLEVTSRFPLPERPLEDQG